MLRFLQRILTVGLRTARKPGVIRDRRPGTTDDARPSLPPLSAEDIDQVIEQWQIEEALEMALLTRTERVPAARRVVGFMAAMTAFVTGVVGVVWVFHNAGLGLALLGAYALPLFVLLVMLGVERTVSLGKD